MASLSNSRARMASA